MCHTARPGEGVQRLWQSETHSRRSAGGTAGGAATCTDIDALVRFRQSVGGIDKYFLYQINGRGMNSDSAYVFKASTHMAEIGVEMDTSGTGFMRDEYAFVDAKHDRCRDYKTLTLWTYHRSMRKLLRLAVMDVEQENTESLTRFWNVFNSMLQDFTGDPMYMFNPVGFIADEHHANFRAIKAVFGESGAKRIKTCEFHYKQCVQRHMNNIDAPFRDEFKRLAYDMLEAQSRSDCHVAVAAMEAFCARHTTLKAWCDWWLKRKEHVFRAFKHTSTPASNLPEVGHAQIASLARTNTTLLEAARDDVAYAIRQQHELRVFTQGQPVGGRGISVNRRRAKQHQSEVRRAEACAREVAEMYARAELPTYIPRSGRHRPIGRRKKSPGRGRQLQHVASNVVCARKRTAMSLRTVRKRSVRLPAESDEETGGPSTVRPHSPTQVEPGAVNYYGDDKTFQIVFCKPAVKKCYGCRQPFRQLYRRPPNNLLLQVYCH